MIEPGEYPLPDGIVLCVKVLSGTTEFIATKYCPKHNKIHHALIPRSKLVLEVSNKNLNIVREVLRRECEDYGRNDEIPQTD